MIWLFPIFNILEVACKTTDECSIATPQQIGRSCSCLAVQNVQLSSSFALVVRLCHGCRRTSTHNHTRGRNIGLDGSDHCDTVSLSTAMGDTVLCRVGECSLEKPATLQCRACVASGWHDANHLPRIRAFRLSATVRVIILRSKSQSVDASRVPRVELTYVALSAKSTFRIHDRSGEVLPPSGPSRRSQACLCRLAVRRDCLGLVVT